METLVVNVYNYAFLNTLNINRDLTVTYNQADLASNFTQLPSMQVSSLAEYFQNNLLGNAYLRYTHADPSSLITKIIETPLLNIYPSVYTVFQMVLLETISLDYAFTQDQSLLERITPANLRRVRKNLHLLCTWCGNHFNDYGYLLPSLRELEVAVGYLDKRLSFMYHNVDYH